MQNLVEIAEAHARQAGAAAIRSVTIEVGDLSGVLAEALEFAFDVCTEGTLAEGARLVLRRIAGRGRCGSCQTVAPVDSLTALCPACGALAFAIDQGTELRILELEIA